MFYPLKIKNIRRETADCVSLAFEIPAEWQTIFQYQSGQYLTLKTMIAGEEVRRSYSLCSSPSDGEWRVAVKQVEDGAFSTLANRHLKPGDTLEVMPPMGHFTLPKRDSDAAIPQKHYVFFAAGSGITPIISLLKTILETEPQSTCVLVYGNRNGASVIFREAIEGLKNRHLQRLQLFHILSRERVDNDLGFGRLDPEKVRLFFDKIPDIQRGDEFFMCGPFDVIEAVREALKLRDVPTQKIHFELFNAPKKKDTGSVKPTDTYKKSIASIRLDGLTFEVSIPEGMSILDAAQAAGADLPFACKGGVCCTCRAKLTEGEVEMETNFALSEEETDGGYILTCQSIPKTERLVLNFDL